MAVMTLREWLQQKLKSIDHIQTVVQSNHADLEILSWTGVRVQLHMLATPAKPRTLRRILHEATEMGINTLFMVDARLLPEDGTRIPHGDWLVSVQAIGNGHIYAYHAADGRPQVFQVHLEDQTGNDEFRVWYGPQVPLTRMRFFRHSIKQPRSIKGDWLVADFDSNAFWKNNDFRNYRQQQQRQQRSSRQTTWYTYSAYQSWRDEHFNGPQPASSPIQTHLENCYKVLGLTPEASRMEVKSAFRKGAKALHPDTSKLPLEEAKKRFYQLQDAYKYIKAANGWS